MYYRNETQHEPYPLTLPGCLPSCPLMEFAKLVAPVIPQDWSTECMTTSNDQGTGDVWVSVSAELCRKGRIPFLQADVALRIWLGHHPQIWGKWVRGDNCLFQGPPTSVNSYLSPCPLPKPWLGFSSVNRKGYHVKIESEIKLRSKFMGLPMIGHTVWGSFFKNSQLSLEWD